VISTRHAKATASGSRDEFLDSTLELFLDLNPLLRSHASWDWGQGGVCKHHHLRIATYQLHPDRAASAL